MKDMMPIKEQRALCVRKVRLWAEEGGTLSDENRAITARLMAEPHWKHLGEREFIEKVYREFDNAVQGY